MNKIDLTIVLPVHNESDNIKSFSSKLYDSFHNSSINYEVIFVENGSSDDTLKKVQKLCREKRNSKYFISKQGWGNAVKEGIKNAKGKYFCYMVTDNQIDPSCIPGLFEIILKNNNSLVKVTRITREDNTRLLMSRIYNFISYIFVRSNSMDINATPKIIKTSIIKELKLESENIVFDLELISRLKKKNIVWIEVPIRSGKRTRGRSTVNIFNIFEMLRGILRYR